MSTDSIIEFPGSLYGQRIAEMQSNKSLQAIQECFQYAVEYDLGRAPILEFVTKNVDRIKINPNASKRFVEWIADNCEFVIEDAQDATLKEPVGTQSRRLADEAYESYFEEARDLGAEAAERGSGPYRWFTAGWEVDSEAWSNIFAESDPATVIAQYADQMLNGPGPNNYIHRPKFRLGKDDVAVVELLIPIIAAEIERQTSEENSSSVPAAEYNLETAIKRAILKESWLEDGCAWYEGSFLLATLKAPPWLVKLLIDYFAGLNYDQMEPVLQGRSGAAALVSIILRVVGCAYLTALDPENPLKDMHKAFPGIKGIKPDIRYVANFIQNIELLDVNECLGEEAIDDPQSIPLRSALNKLRPTLFQHVLPFSRFTNTWLVDPIPLDCGTNWLAAIASAEIHGGDDQPNPFGIFYWSSSERLEYRGSGLERMRLFREAFEAINAEGLHELAGAWWAFFLATQAILYGHSLGLYPDELRSVFQIAEIVRSVKCVIRAVQLMLELARSDPSLNSKVTLTIFANYEAEQNQPSSVIYLHADPERAERYLEKTIGKKVWQLLQQHTRQDLIDAEGYWTANAYQYASSREDWGGIAQHYYRSIERESREKLREFFVLIDSAIDPAQGLTMGVMLKLVRQASKVRLPSVIADQVSKLKKVLGEFGGLENSRNRAGHGGDPIDESRLTKTRKLIYRDKIFAQIIELSQAFEVSQRRYQVLCQITRQGNIQNVEQDEFAELNLLFGLRPSC